MSRTADKRHARKPPARAEPLFDEAFQRKLEYLALVSSRMFRGRQRAERRSSASGGGLEFADYRAYAPGDDYRHVDWGVYRRLGRLLLRLHEEELDLPVFILVDCSGSMAVAHPPQPSKLDFARRLAAALGYVALSHLDRVAFVGLRSKVVAQLPATRGRHRIFTIFDFLGRLQAEGETNLGTALGQFVAQHRRPGVAILLSDLFDTHGFEAGLDKLRYARYETHVLQIVDPRDAQPPALGDVELVDAEGGERRRVTITPALARRYSAAYDDYLARTARFCRDKQLSHFTLAVSTPPEDAVLELLRRGGVVA